jgi:hypothetical protein
MTWDSKCVEARSSGLRRMPDSGLSVVNRLAVRRNCTEGFTSPVARPARLVAIASLVLEIFSVCCLGGQDFKPRQRRLLQIGRYPAACKIYSRTCFRARAKPRHDRPDGDAQYVGDLLVLHLLNIGQQQKPQKATKRVSLERLRLEAHSGGVVTRFNVCTAICSIAGEQL